MEMLQDLVVAACNEATKKVDEETQRKTAGLLGGLGFAAGLAVIRHAGFRGAACSA